MKICTIYIIKTFSKLIKYFVKLFILLLVNFTNYWKTASNWISK